jgi:hypothetical protein
VEVSGPSAQAAPRRRERQRHFRRSLPDFLRVSPSAGTFPPPDPEPLRPPRPVPPLPPMPGLQLTREAVEAVGHASTLRSILATLPGVDADDPRFSDFCRADLILPETGDTNRFIA